MFHSKVNSEQLFHYKLRSVGHLEKMLEWSVLALRPEQTNFGLAPDNDDDDDDDWM